MGDDHGRTRKDNALLTFTVPGPSPAPVTQSNALKHVLEGTDSKIHLLAETIAEAKARATALMEEEVASLVGARYERTDQRGGYRNGTAPGFVVLGGRKMKMDRPRVIGLDGREVPLQTYQAMQDTEELDEAALAKVVSGVVQRAVGGAYANEQPVPAGTETYGASAASISRRWIRATERGLAQRFTRRLDDRRYVAILLDGKGFGDHLLVTAMGIDLQGDKHILGIVDGSSESEAVCAGLLDDLTNRGLDISAGVLVVMDGGTGLAAAVRSRWGADATVARCREHKKRNVLSKLPKGERVAVRAALSQAWRNPDAEEAKRQLVELATDLETNRPDAASSLREGLAETLTLQRLGLQAELGAVLGTTNLIENAYATTEATCRRVKRWRDPGQAKRWALMALLKAAQGFRRAAKPAVMAQLAAALDRRQSRRTAVA